MKFLLKSQKGQTSVEYILMIVVVSILSMSVFKKLEGYLISNPDSFKNTYLGKYKNMFEGGSTNLQYKQFTLRR
jgi:Flp pilus assembly pilin Flp